MGDRDAPVTGDAADGVQVGEQTVRVNVPPVDLDLHAVIELIAGLTVVPGYRLPSKQALVRLMKDRLLQVGLLGLGSWCFGLDAEAVAKARGIAFVLVYKHFRAELLPDFDGPVTYTEKVEAWKASLDPEQMRRYVNGKLPMFSEPGRKVAREKAGDSDVR